MPPSQASPAERFFKKIFVVLVEIGAAAVRKMESQIAMLAVRRDRAETMMV